MRRETLDDNLTQLRSMLDEMGPLVSRAFHDASQALLHDRRRLAEQVVARDPIIDGHRDAVELLAVETMNIHQPVVSPLRSVVTALRCAQQLERMGDLARHVAETVARDERHGLAEQARPLFTEYGARVAAMGDKAVEVLRTRNVVLAYELRADDDAVDALHREVFELMFGESWTAGVPAAVDVALLARFHERYADHCVHLADHVVYAVTGGTPNQVAL